ncbi:hypothetical protein MMU07_13795 [Aquiflexum sp. LQ15W]|nr:hypothetical protein [Cognataquiflexum nitidum]MCH6200653.1 hypothetical protein [Cognataquiflexum nitidum]
MKFWLVFHGLGFGDMSKAGNNDVIIKGGCWGVRLDPRTQNWKFHSTNLR